MFERFTERARAVLAEANRVATELKSPAIRRHHLLIGLIDASTEGSGSVAAVLDDAGIDRADLRAKLVASLQASEAATETKNPPFTREAKKTLELSLREALSLGHNYIGREHLLLGVLRDADGPLAAVLGETRLTHQRARAIVADESPPSVGRGRRRGGARAFRIGRRTTDGLQAVLRRTFDRAGNRDATTGDLLIALLETPGTHFHALVDGATLPTGAKAAADGDLLVQAGTPDGVEDAVSVDPRGGVTINDPRIAEAVSNLVGDKVTPEKLQEILRRLTD